MQAQDLTTFAHNINTATLKGQTMKDATTDAELQAAAQYDSIVSMLDALDVDYDRLEELKDEQADLINAVTEAAEELKEAQEQRSGDVDAWHALEDAKNALTAWQDENAEELEELISAAGDCTDEDEARDRISEDPLDIQVRSDWTSPSEGLEPSEFMILLCTGGPAVRIIGELDQYGEPCRAWMEYQDWGTPWTQYFGADNKTLCRYASHFFGG